MSSKTYYVIVVGYKGQGKSEIVQKLSGDNKYKGKDDKITSKKFGLSGSCTVQIVDTPGLGSLTTSDYQILDRISKEARCMEQVDAILIVFKMGRIKCTQMEAVNQFRKIFGDDFLQKSIIVLTFADVIKQENTSIEKCIANSPEPFQILFKQCGKRIWCVENSDWEDREQKQDELMELIQSVANVHYEVPGAERVKCCRCLRRCRMCLTEYWCHCMMFLFYVICCGRKPVCIALTALAVGVFLIVVVHVAFDVTNS
ncbi:uncharacterized protein LOC106154743 isoform X2 [Lingula anatina]|uniref:Uncharacterized protein LOC106154743 isoform X2 n=1 Tax=Lingula anatina TaxID=7574 RepID=A0A1S3HGQ3_LINAN|nr:uncharacterized protein LOC106154743 isoform X2 [Lingula anatina]|eukprot:XP_013384656.1 uncharacterized protein LOC106154743 isoform X2 [Lingula anatina]